MADPLDPLAGPPGILPGPWKPGDPVRDWQLAGAGVTTIAATIADIPAELSIPVTLAEPTVARTIDVAQLTIPVTQGAPAVDRTVDVNQLAIPVILAAPTVARAIDAPQLAIPVVLIDPSVPAGQFADLPSLSIGLTTFDPEVTTPGLAVPIFTGSLLFAVRRGPARIISLADALEAEVAPLDPSVVASIEVLMETQFVLASAETPGIEFDMTPVWIAQEDAALIGDGEDLIAI